jgi:hypothetical protein
MNVLTNIKWSDPPVLAAFVTGLLGFILALWNYFLNRKNLIEIEILKSTLSEKNSENNARRDYEYEARKRLYQEYEPLLFQLIEASINATYRIENLSKSIKNGDFGDEGWLSRYNYYTRSTIYKLFAPIAIFKLMQKKLTFIDLSVDRTIDLKYKLAKQLYLCYTDDFELAGLSKNIDYDPNNINWKELRLENPIKYCRQGVPMGLLDKTIDIFIEKDENGKEQIISFGEFEKKTAEGYDNKSSPIYFSRELFYKFHPKQKPILWRIIITQLLLFDVLISLSEMPSKDIDEFTIENLIMECSKGLIDKFIWDDDLKVRDEMHQPFDAAVKYLQARFVKKTIF